MRKAFSLLRRLKSSHCDNCKVRFGSRTAHSYALRALIDGHDQERIVRCYEDALIICHGFAVDRSASLGKLVFFNPSPPFPRRVCCSRKTISTAIRECEGGMITTRGNVSKAMRNSSASRRCERKSQQPSLAKVRKVR